VLRSSSHGCYARPMWASIIAGVIATCLAVAAMALAKNWWENRHRPSQMLGGLPARLVCRFRGKEPPGQIEAVRMEDMLDSDDEDIWPPLL